MVSGGGAREVRRFSFRDFPASVFARRAATSTVCLPVLNEERNLGATLAVLDELRESGVIERVIVVAGGSVDASPAIARRSGALLVGPDDLLPDWGPLLGKGDALWRALSLVDTDLVAFFDADLASFSADYVRGALGPLVVDERIAFVKATFDRPLGNVPGQGGRVTEGFARPLLGEFYPQLRRFRQPLSGQIAARTAVLRALPFATGYGIDIGLLIDAHRAGGFERMAEVDIGVLLNDHQPAAALGQMAFQVGQTLLRRAARDGLFDGPVPTEFLAFEDAVPARPRAVDLTVLERPPMDTVVG
ncbi:MAG TPA: glycosyltransferase [Miltoncostaeaceae bacterium]|nr:glycosyltransferase [Miltoncostaeaceae bacterium]